MHGCAYNARMVNARSSVRRGRLRPRKPESAGARDALEPRTQSTRGVGYVPAQLRAAWLHRSLTGDRPRLILDTPRAFSAPRCDGALDWEVCLARCWHDGHRG